ncbi:ATP-binding protein [Massilia forsythiae]|uniref:ATP-binding protein n=1 Tax=Massilia forsythiae TaxID=2728020 RepID=A0A7Z2ZS84_9BURK|nr:SbcC/MukB-like Walker B domain-containing protein [Massilia forsythiae]QJE00223.1 ATP-binding protein [Massilia forsythiae]
MNTPMPGSAQQFRMTRLQVFNWGTFGGLHDIPVSERGFLIVGRSGAGKSTLLDALSALLVPPRWLDFNAAAREATRAGRDRSLVSYVRGAWTAQTDAASGESAVRYLRSGTTWTALALQYANGLGQQVALVQLFWVRGNANANRDVKPYFLVLERDFDLRELQDFAGTNFDVRKLKQALPDAFARDEFLPYRERFCRLLGIDSEMALRLLHKTQSAKNVGDLNAFLRDFMLDKPETFEVADRLVNEFGALNAAHQAVVTAREQVQVLAPARSRHQKMETLAAQHSALQELVAGMHSYRERLRMTLLAEHIDALGIALEGMAGNVRRHQDVLANRSAALADLQRQRREAGGEQIEFFEKERQTLETQRDERMRKRTQAIDACKTLGWDFRPNPQGFAELIGMARQEIDDWQNEDRQQDAILALDRELTAVAGRRAGIDREVLSLRRQPSNIPAPMLALRREIADAVGVAEAALPFVGELIEVKPGEAAWRGAIERVLHGFALSILVHEDQYAAVSSHVNQTDLGRKLVYYRTVRAEQPARPLQAQSLVLKLQVKEGGLGGWLQIELRQRFDYDCVDSLRAFRAAHERALTREGQIKHNRARHEKDDRSNVDARQHWVLGFDNREKLALYEQEARQLQQQEEQLRTQLAGLRGQRLAQAGRLLQCQTLVNLQWQEVDVLPSAERIAVIQRQLDALRNGNTDLQRIDERLRQQDELVQGARTALNEELVEQRAQQKLCAEQQAQLAALQQDPGIVPLTPHQQAGLDGRYAAWSERVRLKEVDNADRAVGKTLQDELRAIDTELAQSEKYVEAQFAIFVNTWRADTEGLDPRMAAATDFFRKLARLESDGLPAHEQRFFDLLKNQSHQNLAALSSYLNDARKAILARMDLVNESLRQVPFNSSEQQRTYLYIQPKDRQLPEVRQFKQDIVGVLSHAWIDDRAFAETRFIDLRRLVNRLASQEPEHRRWRDAVLDVRQHVEFIGKEFDEAGQEVQVHQSGAGLSGGQRQKLATTVLAAALRYQLGGSDNGVPRYAPVVLDEAFDKADNEFTALAMNIFANFGFQMIVATPLKSVMTLEPFIGGACFVDIRERKASSVLLIEYDDERQRLKLSDRLQTGDLLETAG